MLTGYITKRTPVGYTFFRDFYNNILENLSADDNWSTTKKWCSPVTHNDNLRSVIRTKTLPGEHRSIARWIFTIGRS